MQVNICMIKFILVCSLILSGCTVQSATKPISYGSSQAPKTKLYEEPDVVFKDDHTPSSCRSPFR